MCRLSRLGRSKALPHTSQGRRVRSPLGGRGFGELLACRRAEGSSSRSPAVEDAKDSPDSDFRSSASAPLGGLDTLDAEQVMNARDKSDIDRSSGESGNERLSFNTHFTNEETSHISVLIF